MANTSPTPVKEPTNSLTILPNIVENFSAIAKDLVEYVKLRTDIDIVPQAGSIQPTPTPTPISEMSVDGQTERTPKSIFGKILGGITKVFSPKLIIGALAVTGIVSVLVLDMFEGFRQSFSNFTSNLWDKMKDGFTSIGDWFSNLFSKGGELISNLYDGVAEFIQPFKDRVVGFFTRIGDYISEKFASVTSFIGKFEIFGKQEKPKMPVAPNDPVIKKEDLENARISTLPREEIVTKDQEKVKQKNKNIEVAEPTPSKLEKSVVQPVLNKRPISPQNTSITRIRKTEKSRIGKPTQVVSGMEDTKAMIIQHEGIRYEPYKDSLGLWTVGVGHLIGDGKTLPTKMNRKFSDEEVSNMFEQDFAHHKKIAEKTPGYQSANEGGKAAFIDLAFNMGKWWPKWPTTKKLLANDRFDDAALAMEDSKWYNQVGNRAVTITNLVAQAGGSQGQAIATGSNEIAVSKRGMAKPETSVIVNAPTTNNNNLINNDITPIKQDKTGISNSLSTRLT